MFSKEGIRLPSDRWVYYPQLRTVTEAEIANDDRLAPGQLVYWSSKYKSWVQLYGGKIVENLIQAFARDVVTEVHAHYAGDVVMQGHDELVQCVLAETAERRKVNTIRAMSVAPGWCKHPFMGYPPLSAEGYVSDCYADTTP